LRKLRPSPAAIEQSGQDNNMIVNTAIGIVVRGSFSLRCSSNGGRSLLFLSTAASSSWKSAAVAFAGLNGEVGPSPPRQQQRRRCRRRCFSSSSRISTEDPVDSSRREKSPSLELHRRHYEELRNEVLPHVQFSSNAYDLERHGRGESYHPTRPPDLVAAPSEEQDVRELVQYCFKHRIPLVPFGAGTSVEGHVNALFGGVCLDMSEFQSITDVPDVTSSDSEYPDPHVTVGAGVTRMRLNEALRHTGYQFSVDPGADATLGGMMATGASGTSTVKHGTMRDNLLECRVVLADSETDASVVRCGTKALKNSAGYDLLSLFCGSEGTLGVITSVTVKLHPVPQFVVAATCQFESLYQAAAAVSALKITAVPLSRCELLDTASVEAFNAYNTPESSSTPMEVKPTLFLEFEGHSELSLQEVVSMTEDVCVNDYGGSSFAFASDEHERRTLWSARHSLYYATVAYRHGATGAILADAAVPLSHFASVIDETVKDVEKYDVVGPCFGHAGDGNLHCILPIKEDDSEEYMERVHTVYGNLIDRTLAVGGTCTGEHGIGYGKIPYLERQYGPEAVRVMETIKRSLDPRNIMNPGKVVNVEPIS